MKDEKQLLLKWLRRCVVLVWVWLLVLNINGGIFMFAKITGGFLKTEICRQENDLLKEKFIAKQYEAKEWED